MARTRNMVTTYGVSVRRFAYKNPSREFIRRCKDNIDFTYFFVVHLTTIFSVMSNRRMIRA
jgi:hypothetical protein